MNTTDGITEFWKNHRERALNRARLNAQIDAESSREPLVLHPGEVFVLRDTAGASFPLIYTIEHGYILLRLASSSESADAKQKALKENSDAGLRSAVRLSFSAISVIQPQRKA